MQVPVVLRGWVPESTSLPFLPAANEKPKTKEDWSDVPYGCLVRATDGKKKVSTIVSQKDLGRFQDAYRTILRVGGEH